VRLANSRETVEEVKASKEVGVIVFGNCEITQKKKQKQKDQFRQQQGVNNLFFVEMSVTGSCHLVYYYERMTEPKAVDLLDIETSPSLITKISHEKLWRDVKKFADAALQVLLAIDGVAFSASANLKFKPKGSQVPTPNMMIPIA